MAETILVTGGAGFIGRHVCRALLERGYKVKVLDALVEQVHPLRERPAELDSEAEFIMGDVRDENAVLGALKDVDAVIHLAAEVGVGQSMYEIDRYTSGNDYGTSVLLQQLIARPVRRIVTASSMSLYGEGLYKSVDGDLYENVIRTGRNPDGSWDPLDDQGRPLIPAPTPESKRPALASVYAIGKYVQELLTMTVAPAYGMECAAMRLWNVYGPGQALSNPYTGVLAIFSSRLANGQRPLIFEDGQQQRDFVHARDVARAFILALEKPEANGQIFNVGSGENRTVQQVAESQAKAMGRNDIEAEVTGKLRVGDIRHCTPDLTHIQQRLGYQAQEDFLEGLAELAEWVARQEAEDRVDEARKELEMRGLVA
ncbi:MAG TPA: SDR family NAD(P)-dependent oxidoreductase [Caulobacteraceae bacterium]|nr:SDR family NAD(P)-dependent oxidoreductase [Caulobacteraceae bacterium]